jgi:hypothetical protein
MCITKKYRVLSLSTDRKRSSIRPRLVYQLINAFLLFIRATVLLETLRIP